MVPIVLISDRADLRFVVRVKVRHDGIPSRPPTARNDKIRNSYPKIQNQISFSIFLPNPKNLSWRILVQIVILPSFFCKMRDQPSGPLEFTSASEKNGPRIQSMVPVGLSATCFKRDE